MKSSLWLLNANSIGARGRGHTHWEDSFYRDLRPFRCQFFCLPFVTGLHREPLKTRDSFFQRKDVIFWRKDITFPERDVFTGFPQKSVFSEYKIKSCNSLILICLLFWDHNFHKGAHHMVGDFFMEHDDSRESHFLQHVFFPNPRHSAISQWPHYNVVDPESISKPMVWLWHYHMTKGHGQHGKISFKLFPILDRQHWIICIII